MSADSTVLRTLQIVVVVEEMDGENEAETECRSLMDDGFEEA